MASVKIILKRKILSDGTYPIYLRVTKDRDSKFYKTPFSSKDDEWKSSIGSFNKRKENYIQKNRLLLKFKDRALQILTELEIDNPDYTILDFDSKFRITFNPLKNDVFAFWDEIIEEQTKAGRIGNAKVNNDAKTSVKIFHRFKKLSFKELNPTFLNKYEVFLRSRGGTDGGIGVKMRAIRAIFNMAIQRGLVKDSFYPFRVYKISKLKGKSAKRALNFEEIMDIVNLNLKDYPHLINTKNYFVFSFYTRGMNFKDMVELEWSNIHSGCIHYVRSKTKGNFRIKILPPVQDILDYYQMNGYGNKYVFPFLYREDYTPIQVANRKHKVLGVYNKQLKELAELCDIKKNISSYVARHSFANCLKQKGVATDIISESMGHQNLAVTQAYLKDLDTVVLEEAAEMLL
ncbi:site-specific integrase [Aureibaculum sp. 2210JD6-5]|uniref:site-specific integrase n=1 Tax=Aureibaculum sp. 2210JD6-5 TaxID=3103957 RepID=UPI002AAEA350|nr:site-specific integrase [Aureibaculum sp. 2210JD6-5]MDY7396290.1 site-specific integrase [Aureibaculum sp. 2210JD6-5]